MHMGIDSGTTNTPSLEGLGYLLNAALGGTPFQFPQTLRYQDGSSPFSVEATLGQWCIAEGAAGNCIEITIASGTLRDIDKGTFSLSGIALTFLVDGQITPVAVVNPGPLSELQQEGLLDAVGTYLNAPAVHYRIATVSLEPRGTENSATIPSALGSARLPGLLVSAKDGSNSPAALFTPPAPPRPFICEPRPGSVPESDQAVRSDDHPAVGGVALRPPPSVPGERTGHSGPPPSSGAVRVHDNDRLLRTGDAGW
jgi:hypothetical protein